MGSMNLILGFAVFFFSFVLTQCQFSAKFEEPETYQIKLKKYFLDLFKEAIAKRKHLETPQNRKQSGINRKFGGNEFESFGDNAEHPENNEIVEKLTGTKNSPFEAYGYGHHKFHHHKHNHTNDHQHLHSQAHKHGHTNTHNETFLHVHNHKHLHKHDHHHEHQKKEEWRRNGREVMSNYNW